MQQFHKQVSILAVSVFSLGLLAVVPVSAQTTPVEGGSSSANKEAAAQRKAEAVKNADDAAKQRANDRAAITKVTAGDTTVAATDLTSLRSQADKLVQDQRKQGKVKSADARKKSCEARLSALVKQQENYSAAAERHLGVYDDIYDKVEAFQAKKNLTVANLDALKAAVETKRDTAVDAVEILKALPTFSCDNDDPAEALAAVKLAVSNSRGALKDYRTAIKDLVVALRTAGNNSPSNTAQEAN